MIKAIITDKKELSQICHRVTDFNSLVANDLLDTATEMYSRCAGLAAPQIGSQMRIIVVKLATGFVIMNNPEYIEKMGKLKSGKEGCLSRPTTIQKPVSVKRWYKIKIRYTNVDGVEVEAKFKNFYARVIQHEMDHLDGILI